MRYLPTVTVWLQRCERQLFSNSKPVRAYDSMHREHIFSDCNTGGFTRAFGQLLKTWTLPLLVNERPPRQECVPFK